MKTFMILLLIVTGIWSFVLYEGSQYEEQLLSLNFDAEDDLIIEVAKISKLTKISIAHNDALKKQLHHSRSNGEIDKTLEWIMLRTNNEYSTLKQEIDDILLINIVSYGNNRDKFHRVKIEYHDKLNNPVLKFMYSLCGYPHYL